MSSRLGNVKLLGNILDQTADAMYEVMRCNPAKYAQIPDPEAVSDKVGISAVMVQDMSKKRVHNYPFDIARMMSFEGYTGPYLQYCHARLNSILRKAGLTLEELAEHVANNPTAPDAEIEKKHCVGLLRLMAQYPELSHQLSSSYNVIQVIDPMVDRSVMISRAALYEGARQVLGSGMKLLGLSPVERM
ncbi:Arginyl-tRNA synthetase [Cladobotryum mycophilum]|uniref:arginine--tRNA ligase n=1 Tax=Cladobotryum mycophilum TaxID=491253 RepID=A0ABR0SV48_9HYPO